MAHLLILVYGLAPRSRKDDTVRDTAGYEASEGGKTVTYTDQPAKGDKPFTFFYERR